MTDFDSNCPHGHQTKSGLPRKIVAELEEPLHSGATIITVGPNSDGRNGVWPYHSDGSYTKDGMFVDRDLINAPDTVAAIKAGANTIKVNGIKFAVRNGVVTTVLVTRNEFNRLSQRVRDD